MTTLARGGDFSVNVLPGKIASPIGGGSVLQRGQRLHGANATEHGEGGFQTFRLDGKQNGHGPALRGDDEVALVHRLEPLANLLLLQVVNADCTHCKYSTASSSDCKVSTIPNPHRPCMTP